MNQTSQIRVIIADDHDVYRDGLQLLLSKDPAIDVVAEAENGKALLDLINRIEADVIVTDLRMPILDGVTAIKEIRSLHKELRCIALSTFDSEHLIVEALEAGAMGYIIKNAQKGEIIDAIKTVYDNEPYYCQSTSAHLVKRISLSSFNPYTLRQKELFTDKEIDIIRLICAEKSSKEIGEAIFMSPRTVEGLRAKILEKMKVKTSAGVAIYAIKNALYQVGNPEIKNNLKP